MIQKYKAEFDSDASLLLVHNRYVGRTVIHRIQTKAKRKTAFLSAILDS